MSSKDSPDAPPIAPSNLLDELNHFDKKEVTLIVSDVERRKLRTYLTCVGLSGRGSSLGDGLIFRLLQLLEDGVDRYEIRSKEQ